VAPLRYAELVGQEHVVRALTNALETGRVHPVRVPLRRPSPASSEIAGCERGTSADPCGECETCLAMTPTLHRLLEIDAASNTGVDNVRELIETQYMPRAASTRST
jgi:DNA polymerase-3 subunit gamma/tau